MKTENYENIKKDLIEDVEYMKSRGGLFTRENIINAVSIILAHKTSNAREWLSLMNEAIEIIDK